MKSVVKSGICLSLVIGLTSCVTEDVSMSINDVLGNLGVSNAIKTAKVPDDPTNDRESVINAQTMLNGLGYDAGTADGVVGPKTDRAIRGYQNKKGMASTGEVTPKLLAALKDDSDRDVAQAQNADVRDSAILGGFGAALTGALVSKKFGLSRGQGALLGAAVGAGAGAIVGQQTASLRGEYDEKVSGVDAAIAAEDRQIAGLKSEIASMRSSMQAREQEIDSVVEQAGRGEDIVQRKKQLLKELEADLRSREEISATIKARLKSVNHDIEQAGVSSAKASVDAAALERQITELTVERDQLTTSLNAINGIQPKLEAQRDRLISQVGNQSTG
ncbi:MAG: peptidoglycan-binding protein [Pseudomonadota bacterium]